VPVGVPEPGAVMLKVAVKVTLWPLTEGFGELAKARVVLALFTTCVIVLLVLLALKLLLPP